MSKKSTEELLQILSTGLGAVFAGLLVFQIGPVRLWAWLCVLYLVASIALVLLDSEWYFINAGHHKGAKPVHRDGVDLFWGILLTSVGLMLTAKDQFTYADAQFWWILLGSVVAVAVLAFVFLWKAPDNSVFAEGELVLLLVLCAFSYGMWLNHLLDFREPMSQQAVVVELESNRSRRSVNYRCTVELPDGEQQRLNVTRAQYRFLDEGDVVTVISHTGAFGVAYDMVEMVD